MKASYRAFSLVEMIIMVIIVGVFAAISLPRMNLAVVSKQKVDTVARKIVTDMRRTRRLAISNAAGNSKGFSLKMTGTSPYSGYQIVNLQSRVVVDTQRINSPTVCNGDREFKFGPMGNLLTGTRRLALSAAGKSFTITVVPATGTVKCTEN